MNQPIIDWDDATIKIQPITFHAEHVSALPKRGRPRNPNTIRNKHNTLKEYCAVCDKTYFKRYMYVHKTLPAHLNRVKNV